MAARRLFAEHGYSGTSLNDIAAEVGIRRPSLLHHFGHKEALYQEVFKACLAEWLVAVNAAVEEIEGGWPLLDAVLDASSAFFRRNPEAVRLIRREAIDGGANLDFDVALTLRPIFDRAVAFLEREMASGVFRRMAPRDLLISAYAALFGYFSDASILAGLIDCDPLDPARVTAHVDHLRDLFRSALRPDG